MVNQEIDSTPSKKFDSTSLATALKEARQTRDWSLEQASEKLKIAVDHLAYLESDQLEISRLDPFKRGYLRNYAELLGVDISDYRNEFHQEAATETRLQPVSAEDPSVKPVFSMAALKIITSVIVIALIVMLVMINI